MINSIKSWARDALPTSLQVPVKYWYDRAKGYSEAEMELLPFLCRAGSHVADVGGNRGSYCYALHKIGARVEVFEPNPVCGDILSGWARHVDGVTVHRVALSATSGTAVLHIPVDEQGVEHDASASIEVNEGSRNNDIEVPLRDLDSFGFSDLDFIKIDTEGHENSVLDGARRTIAASSPAMLIEIEQRHLGDEPIEGLIGSILATGYRGYFFDDGKLVAIARFDAAAHQSLAAFESGSGAYINNFLFLAEARIAADAYRPLFSRFGAA